MHVLTRLASYAAVVGLAATGLTSPAVAEPSAAPAPRAATTVVAPGSFTGYGFDACTAPTQAVMDAWRLSSPYSAVGVYIGGSNRLCDQDVLTADWVRTQTQRGWHVLPIFVGLQAACTDFAYRMTPDLAVAETEGRAEAGTAVANAQALAIGRGSTLYLDLEDYDLAPDDCRKPALAFMSGWTDRLHELGYVSGVYSNLGAAIWSLDVADNVSKGSYSMPDELWFAWENGKADVVSDHRLTSSRWNDHARIHQYDLDVVQSYGGATLPIDRNWVDVGSGSVGSPTQALCKGVDVDLKKFPTLKRGSRGKAVEAAQCLLKRQHLGRAKLTGRYDAATVKAVQKAQRKAGLRPTGKLKKQTWVALLARGSRPLLKVGSTGEPVRRVQRALTAALGRKVRVDGAVGKSTAAAVAAFQRRERLPVTGNVDTATWERLQAGG